MVQLLRHSTLIEMLLLKHHIAPVLWEHPSETIAWYQDNDRWADEAIRQLGERSFTYSDGETSAAFIVRFSGEKLTEIAGAPERPLAVARAIAAILSNSEGLELFTGKRGLTLLSAQYCAE